MQVIDRLIDLYLVPAFCACSGEEVGAKAMLLANIIIQGGTGQLKDLERRLMVRHQINLATHFVITHQLLQSLLITAYSHHLCAAAEQCCI